MRESVGRHGVYGTCVGVIVSEGGSRGFVVFVVLVVDMFFVSMKMSSGCKVVAKLVAKLVASLNIVDVTWE